MRDFTIDDIVKEIARDYPHIDEKVLKKVCTHSLNQIIGIVKKGKAQIHLRKADIHSIYQEVNVTDVFADLDESRCLNREELKLAKAQERAAKGVYTTRKRRGGKVRRVYDTRLAAYPVYAGTHPEGSLPAVREPEQCGEEVQSTCGPAGQ